MNKTQKKITYVNKTWVDPYTDKEKGINTKLNNFAGNIQSSHSSYSSNEEGLYLTEEGNKLHDRSFMCFSNLTQLSLFLGGFSFIAGVVGGTYSALLIHATGASTGASALLSFLGFALTFIATATFFYIGMRITYFIFTTCCRPCSKESTAVQV